MGTNARVEEPEGPRKTPLAQGCKFSLPVTHKLYTGLIQVDGFPQGLSSHSYLSQLTRQVLHQGQQLSSDIVSLD